VNLALLTARDTTPRDQLHAEFERLFKSIVELRAAMLELARDLGKEVGDEGRDLAFQLATGHTHDDARQHDRGGTTACVRRQSRRGRDEAVFAIDASDFLDARDSLCQWRAVFLRAFSP